MCFTVHVDHSKPKVAENNVPIIKTVHFTNRHNFDNPTKYSSICQHSPLYLGKQKETIKLIVKYVKYIHEGYHSYTPKAINRAKSWNYDYILNGYIPKGETYYYNPEDHEYVSSNIVLTNKIVFDNTEE